MHNKFTSIRIGNFFQVKHIFEGVWIFKNTSTLKKIVHILILKISRLQVFFRRFLSSYEGKMLKKFKRMYPCSCTVSPKLFTKIKIPSPRCGFFLLWPRRAERGGEFFCENFSQVSNNVQWKFQKFDLRIWAFHHYYP